MKIQIRNVKGITRLNFELPLGGVWIMTGINGTGKSTILAALYRIRYPYAFQQFFRTSPLAQRVDLYNNASITYEINEQSVTYKYGGQRWRATPRANSNLLDNFPYPTVIYLEANSDRIEPYADEITHNKLRDASPDIKDFMVAVLANNKWGNLKYVNTRRGRGNEAFLIPYRAGPGRPYNYYSEKSFSLGELCVLRLATRLSDAQHNSLILIDELEMALHPQAQVRLLERLRSVGQQKNFTVIFSTHSASLIKTAGRRQLIHLTEGENSNIDTIRNPYPAQILGEVAFDDELGADFIFFVEDKQAKILLEQLIQEYLVVANPEIKYQPLCKIAPVGGFVQVLEFVNASSQIFPNYVRRVAFLDEDVKTESVRTARQDNNIHLLDLFNRSQRILNYLPCTPEVGLIEIFEGGLVENNIRTSFPGHAVNMARLIQLPGYTDLNNQNQRALAKNKVDYLVNCIAQTTGYDTTQILRIFYRLYTKHKYGNATGELRALLGPIFNADNHQ